METAKKNTEEVSWYGCNIETAGKTLRIVQDKLEDQMERPENYFAFPSYGFEHYFGGEKNFGEIGPPRLYIPDYDLLRVRSWQSYMESEITQTVIKRFGTWVVGKGLKCQSEPSSLILESEGIKLDTEEFSKLVEGKFSLFASSKRASYSKMITLNNLAKEVHKNAKIGGDVLVIMRFENKQVSIQVIDGAHVQSPLWGNDVNPAKLANGNRIINGVEINESGEHVRYYVRDSDFNYKPIEARGAQSGLQMAFMVYGSRYRLDSTRGLPLITTVLETLKKMERYKEALVASAEERQKIPYAIQHDLNGTGEGIFNRTNLLKAVDAGAGILPKDVTGKQLANYVAATFNKMFVNLPPGAKLTSLDSKNEFYFKDFYSANIDIICATINIPPNVAMSKYDASFSASRASLKDWEHTLLVERADLMEQFYQPIYNFWLEMQILLNKVKAPGYIEARMTDNQDVIEAYQKARFIGVGVPHIDPEKEANAERIKLGSAADHIPLTTAEAATEMLNSGEFAVNLEQFSKELNKVKELGIEQPVNTQIIDPAGKKKKEDNSANP